MRGLDALITISRRNQRTLAADRFGLSNGEPVQRVNEKLATQSGLARASDASGTI
jgi:hypothetical protein